MKKEQHLHKTHETYQKPDSKSSKINKIFFYAMLIPLAVQILISLFLNVNYEQLSLHPYGIILHTTIALFISTLIEKKTYVQQYLRMLAGFFCYGIIYCLIYRYGPTNIYAIFGAVYIFVYMTVAATIGFLLTKLVLKYKEQYKKLLTIAAGITFLGFFIYHFFIIGKIICVYNQQTGQPVGIMRVHYVPRDEKSYQTTASMDYSQCLLGPNALYEDLKSHQAFQFFNGSLDFMNGSNAHDNSVDAQYTLDGNKLFLTMPKSM